MNPTIAMLTLSGMLGRRRGVLLLILPGILIALALGIRLSTDVTDSVTVSLLQSFALGTIVPLLGLIVGTGVIGPEIDDGSIVYVLAKPIARPVVVVTKLLVAAGVTTVFGAIPVLIAGLIMSGGSSGLAIGFGFGALIAGITYSALFLLLAVVTRNAVVFGLLYALVWESLIGGFVPGAKDLSVQQWALSVTHELADPAGFTAAVGPAAAIPLLIVVTIAAAWFAAQRLRSLTLTDNA